eukprot:4587240-Amphidinium_carterae.1
MAKVCAQLCCSWLRLNRKAAKPMHAVSTFELSFAPFASFVLFTKHVLLVVSVFCGTVETQLLLVRAGGGRLSNDACSASHATSTSTKKITKK